MKILANDGVSQAGVDMLENAGHEVIQTKVAQEQLASYLNENSVDVILVRSATKVRKGLIDACPNLKIIGRGGVGLDNIDVDYAKSKGLHVINTPAASSDSVAELVMAHALGGFRFLHLSNREMPLEGESNFKTLKKSYAKGVELKGKTMGIVGMGRIGQAVAKRAIGMGMTVIGHDKFMDEADVSRGNIPQDVIENEQLIEKLPIFFRTVRGAELSDEKIDDLIEDLRQAYSPDE